ncbi:MAG: PstS family phosphate ABC transporter substrate-binding protein [Clostridia bacterium]|nr:PstS family phosphate ABC transporter substrate-binding protein [Clostridia bacterium]
MKLIKSLKNVLVISTLALSLIVTAGCGNQAGNNTEGDKKENTAATDTNKDLSGKIAVDGSSTVYPITMAVAEEFKSANPNVEVSVAMAGTGGGMKKFYAGEIDICDASRPIKEEEIEKCKEKGIEYVEFMVAYDGISVVVNKDNNWVDSITAEELKKIWEKDSKVKKWKDVNPAWPDAEIKLYGPGTDSGTFEFFTKAINGKEKESRTDFTPSEDDNVIVQGVSGDKNAMGYFGFAYYEENADKLKVLKIGGIEPTFDSIKDLSYKPLSRPLYIYVNKAKLEQEHVKTFVKFYLENADTLVKDVKYVPLTDYKDELAKIK